MEERLLNESLVLSCIYKDFTLVNEVNEDYFSVDKTIFFYNLAKEMSKTIKEINEMAVATWCSSNGVIDRYYDLGGYDSIKNLLNMDTSLENFEGYVDTLRKHIIVDQARELNFDLNKEYKVDEARVIPMEILPYLTSTQFGGIIQSIILQNIGMNVLEENDKLESLHYTEEEIEKRESGELDDTAPFDITMTFKDVDNGEDRYVQSFKMLNNELNGVCRKNGVMFIGASSGSGKTTVTLQMVLGLIEAGEKVLFISNEQTSKYFKDLLMAFVCINVFRCFTVSRKKISKWNLTDEEKQVFLKANEFIKEKYEGRLSFWGMNEFDFNKISNKMLKLQMTEGYRYLVLDTFKPTNLESNVTNEYVQLSRDLDTFGRKHDIGIMCPIQLLSSTDKLSYLTASQITNSKQIKEIASKIILFRKCRNMIELNPENKSFFLKPYVWHRNPVTGRYEKKYLKIINSQNPAEKKYEFDKDCVDVSKRFLVFFIDKNRSGEDSIVYLYQLDGNSGRLWEKGICDNISTGVLMQ